MINPKQATETIVKYLLYLDIIMLIVWFFVYSNELLISIIIMNIIGLGLYKIIKRYEYLLQGLFLTNKLANKVNNLAGRING